MKVYFSASISEDQKQRERYSKIIEIIKELGHDVLQYEVSKLHPKELMGRSDNDIKSAHKRLNQFMRQADVYVTDITQASVGVGYEISQALSDKKPVLVLIHESQPYKSRATLLGNTSKLIKYTKYADDELKGIIKSFLDNAKGRIDTKFILIISPEIDKYLEWAASERRMHKAQVVRNAIEDLMDKDKEYKAFLKELEAV